MNNIAPIVWLVVLGFIVTLTLLFAGPVIINQAYNVIYNNEDIVCYPGVENLVKLIPVLYYMMAAGSVAAGVFVVNRLWREE